MGEQHVAREEARRRVLLTEGGDLLQRAHRFERELIEVDAGVNLDERVEVVLGQLVEVVAERLRKRGDILRLERDAHRRLVSAEANKQVRRRFDRGEQVHAPHASARAARLVAVDGQKDARHAVDADQAACHDALHALMPPLARNDERALAVVDFRGLDLRDFGEFRLDRAALVVEPFELGCQAVRLVEVVGHEQVERQVGVAHAPCGVEARNEREAEVRAGEGLADRPRGFEQRGDARARRLVHHLDALDHERAVLAKHRHEVGHRAERREVDEIAPKVGLAEASTERLHELQRHARASEHAALARGVDLRVGNGHAFGDQVRGLVMVGDRDVDSGRLHELHLGLAGDAAVDRHEEVGAVGLHAIERRSRDAVALLEALRNERHRVGPELPQATGENRRRGYAVEVEVAEHEDPAALPDGVLERVDDVAEPGNQVGVEPIVLERGKQERARRLRGVDSAADKRCRDETGQVKFTLEHRYHATRRTANVELS